MKWTTITAIFLVGCIGLAACRAQAVSYSCMDRLGCVMVGPGESIKIGILLTMTTADAPYGIDALRGVEIAIAHKAGVGGHSIELVKEDDLCSAQGGADGATRLAADPKIAGVIGTACSSASVMAARILSGVGSVLISPASTAPSLTDPATHEAGFLRTIYNDKAQGQAVAEFAFNVLGAQRMITIHDGAAYAMQLQAAACETFKSLGGECVKQIQITSGQDVTPVLQQAALDNPDVVFYPVYQVDGTNITTGASLAGLTKPALMSADGLFSTDFLKQAEPSAEGMYISGPANSKEPQSFLEEYKARYGEAPIASYHLQGYDAAIMLLSAIEKVAQNSGGTLYVPRQALRDALFGTRGMQGLSGTLTCSSSGDCAQPNIEIYQVVNSDFKAVYP
jgi:branched-chain amino acid transport system substrate-binding protein